MNTGEDFKCQKESLAIKQSNNTVRMEITDEAEAASEEKEKRTTANEKTHQTTKNKHPVVFVTEKADEPKANSHEGQVSGVIVALGNISSKLIARISATPPNIGGMLPLMTPEVRRQIRRIGKASNPNSARNPSQP